MPKITSVAKARKPTKCSKCSAEIAIGSPYISIKPRYGLKRVRCTKFACRFRPTDLSSAKTAVIEERIEDAEDQIAEASSFDEIESILSEVAETARDVASEYQDASGAWAGGSNQDFDDKADACESFADELESWTYSGEADEEKVREKAREDIAKGGGDTEDEAWESALSEMREEAIDVLSGFSC
jgi:hypothetical protein